MAPKPAKKSMVATSARATARIRTMAGSITGAGCRNIRQTLNTRPTAPTANRPITRPLPQPHGWPCTIAATTAATVAANTSAPSTSGKAPAAPGSRPARGRRLRP